MDNKNNTPEQEINKVLSNAAVQIKRLEQERDKPTQGKPVSRNVPRHSPASHHSTGSNNHLNPSHKDTMNNMIANVKAATMQAVKSLSKHMPGDKQQQMNDKALNNMYPQGNKDVNPVSKNYKDPGETHGDKEVDNAQERFNQKRADYKQKEAQKPDKSTRFTQSLNSKQQAQKDQLGKKMDASKQQKGQQKNSMSTRFTQQLNGNNVQKSNLEQKSVGSMNSRFSQSLGRSAPGGAASGSKGMSGPSKSGSSGDKTK